MASFLKYLDELKTQRTSNGQAIQTGRIDIDRAAYRGPTLPPLKPGEFEQVTERVNDVYVNSFNLLDETQRLAYQAVLDRVVNGRFRLWIHKEEMFHNANTGEIKIMAFAIWSEQWIQPDMRKLGSFGAVSGSGYNAG